MSEPLTPRAWLGDAPFPWPAARNLPGGASLRACYFVQSADVARTRQDQPYLRLGLSDRHGSVAARVWEDALNLAGIAREGSYIGVQAVTEIYNGELQLCIESLAPVRVLLDDLPLFLPCSRRDPAVMAGELETLIDSIGDPPLRTLARALLGADSETGAGFRMAPAAKYNHHAYLGGLLEHTLSVARVCDLLAHHYGDVIDRDLLLTAALLHDVGKVREIGARAGFPYTDEGKLLGHILLGLQMVDAAAARTPGLTPARLLLLRHLIAAHQGRFEWQSPREPATLEALLLHYADDLDAKLNTAATLVERVPLGWTPYDRGFRREFLRHRADSQPVGETPAAPSVEPPGATAALDQAAAIPPVVEPPARPGRPDPPERPRGRSGRAGAAPAREALADPDPGAVSADGEEGRGPPRLSDDTLDLFEGD